MTDLLSLLLSFPPPTPVSEIEYDQRSHSLVSSLRQINPRTLTGDIPGHGNLLDAFDPVQVRYAGHEFNKLIEFVAEASEFASKPITAIKPIQRAMLRLDPSGSTFTSTHTIFARLCLLARCYLPALSVLEQDICHFPTAVDKHFLKRSQLLPCQQHPSSVSYITLSSGLPGRISYRTYLEYFLYGSMIYMSLKKWEKARHFLDIVISAPASNAISMVMLEACKKWILVNLLERGMVPAMPHTVNASVAKAYKALVKPYNALAIVFKTGTFIRLKAEISAGMELWRKDNNTGLVLQVLDAFRRFSVLKLERSFAALAIPDLTQRLALGDRCSLDMERFVAKLLAGSRLSARLFQPSDSSNPTILRFGHFFQPMKGAMEAKLWEQLLEQKRRVDLLVHNLYETDVKFGLGPDYIDGLRKARWRKNGGDNETSASAGGNNSVADFEEDIMADLQ
ncbi:hypothetical protein PRK78_001027 [Emydomyces testavorans]|uniref:COP9 signalosome complex subunit 3 N-terminal helical repeats domain-containing protein n=1 Tax=Emydomyces testavorans TaxID=2070801 RepID=A0AAF0DD93_9EURO|nr:hypothetical protein PRK78_001027 [Emydomyces testavorans]